MAYEFRVGDVTGKSLARIARKQLRRLRGLLIEPGDQASGHHEARKCVKRLRSLLMLLRPAAGKAQWVKLDRQLAKVARALSGPRDAMVLLQKLDLLERENGTTALGKAGERLRAELLAQRKSGKASAGLETVHLKISRLKTHLKLLPLKRMTMSDLLAGFEADYRAGRLAFAHAYAAGTPEAFHELRKHVQRHWRHMQLLTAGWPEEIAVRIDLAKALSELLGEEHDFSVLRQRLGADDADGLSRLCHARQTALRASAHGKLALLFAERPKALRRRLAAYWEVAVELGTQPDPDGAAVSPASVKLSRRQLTS